MIRFPLTVLLGGLVSLASGWADPEPAYTYATLEAEGFHFEKEANGGATLTVPNDNHVPENDLMIVVMVEPSVSQWNIAKLKAIGNKFRGSDTVDAWKWQAPAIEADYPYPDLSLIGKAPGVGGREGNAMIVDVNVVVPPGTTKVTGGQEFFSRSKTAALVILIVGTQVAYDHWNDALDTLFESIQSE